MGGGGGGWEGGGGGGKKGEKRMTRGVDRCDLTSTRMCNSVNVRS